jgi:hypothetical protein
LARSGDLVRAVLRIHGCVWTVQSRDQVRAVDPEWSGSWGEVGKGLVAANGFFTSERELQLAINLPVLMRVVRQANQVVVLTVWDLWVGTRKARGDGDAEVKT